MSPVRDSCLKASAKRSRRTPMKKQGSLPVVPGRSTRVLKVSTHVGRILLWLKTSFAPKGSSSPLPPPRKKTHRSARRQPLKVTAREAQRFRGQTLRKVTQPKLPSRRSKNTKQRNKSGSAV